jgi:hypothetical protein
MTRERLDLCLVAKVKCGRQEIEPSCRPNNNHELTMIEAEYTYVYSPASGKMILSPESKAKKARLRAARLRQRLRADPIAWAEAQRKIQAWHNANRDRVRAHKKKHASKPACKEKKRAYRDAARDKFKIYQRNYISRNPEKRKQSALRYSKTPKARFVAAIRSRVRAALFSKKASTCEYLGCPVAFFRAHLEAQFCKGMTWDNFGKWHMDHIVPLSAFDLSDPKQVQIACNWTNIRPLWAEDNLRKSAKITQPQMSLPLVVQ